MRAKARRTKSPAPQIARSEFEGVLEFRLLERRATRMLCGDASDGNSLRVRSDQNKLDVTSAMPTTPLLPTGARLLRGSALR
jgi:hypothetical protein